MLRRSGLVTKGNTFDIVFPLIAIPNELMQGEKGQAHDFVEEIARYTNFCLEVLESGRHPAQGFYGEKFEPKSKRLERAGKELAGPWVGCFAGNKADNKSRHEFNFFKQWYQCTLMCDECCAQAPHKKANQYFLSKF